MVKMDLSFDTFLYLMFPRIKYIALLSKFELTLLKLIKAITSE